VKQIQYISDPTLLKIAHDLSGINKPTYAKLLTELGLYSLEEMDDEYGEYKRSGREEFIRKTLQGICTDLKDLQTFLQADDVKKKLRRETLSALAMDGIELEHSIAGKYAEPVQERSLLETKLQAHTLQDVQKFLDQSLDNYSKDNFEAANAMSRTALEELIKQIALKISILRRNEIIPYDTNRFQKPQPADYRKYLKQTNFIDDSEFEFLNKFYGYSSGNGSHPGISSEGEARLRRFVVVGICLFYFEKLENKIFMNGLK